MGGCVQVWMGGCVWDSVTIIAVLPLCCNAPGLTAVGKDVLWLTTTDSNIYRYSEGSTSIHYKWPFGLKVTDFLGVYESGMCS